MNTTVTMSYGSLDSLKNAVDDLIGVGIPQLKVITPKASEAEIRELLGRHNPVKH